MKTTIVALALLFGLVVGCGPKDLEVKGLLERAIGETVTLELTQGDVKFGDELELVDAANTAYSKSQLLGVKEGDLKVNFRVPAGVEVGAATVTVNKATGPDKMTVPLRISRLALTFDDQGKLEALPLPGSSLAKSEVAIGSSGGRVSLSPSNGRLAVLSGGEVRLLAVGKALKDAAAGVQAPGGTVVAATDEGAIVGSDQGISVFNLSKSASEVKLTLPRVKAVSVSQDGKRAVALHFCDTNKDNVPDADCVTVVELTVKASLRPQIVIDKSPSASLVAMSADGSKAVVADTDKIYGVDFLTQTVTELPWASPATPVGIDRAPSSLGDLFAIADSTNNIVRSVGFQNGKLAPVSEVQLQEKPSALAYGRSTTLYVAVGTGLLTMNMGHPKPKVEKLSLTTTNPIASLAVQR